MHNLIKPVLNQIKAAFLPHICLLCQSPSQLNLDICSSCQSQLIQTNTSCTICAKPMPNNAICGACIKTPPEFDQTFCLGQFESHLRKLILQLKFHEKLYASQVLGMLMAKRLQAQGQPEVIIPVPLHLARLKQRGFNQSLEIAKILGKALNLSIDRTSCARVKFTLPQTTLPAKKRPSNVRNAFTLNNSIDYKHIAILDDVMTTGSTANELAKLLKKAGAERVVVWCVARA